MATAPSAEFRGDLTADLRQTLEDRFWRPIDLAAAIEMLRRDTGFLDAPHDHPGLYADHGSVHVRDISRGAIELARLANGLLLPRRPPDRQHFLVAYLELITYLHDIGMVDPTLAGRKIHPIYAAHVAFSPELDDVIGVLLTQQGQVVSRLREIDQESPLGAPVGVVLRELLSLTMAHSKSTVPPALLDDPVALRSLLQQSVLVPLAQHRRGTDAPSRADDPPAPAFRHYADPWATSFGWMSSGAEAHARLLDDVVDALRVLRAADALRQRGSALRTAAGYEIFMDAATGDAVYAIRTSTNTELLLLRVEQEIAAGEANIHVAAVSPSGHLRISFERGSYLTDDARRKAVRATARVVADMQADVLPSFAGERVRVGLTPPTVSAAEMLVQLERPGDDPSFADAIAAALLEEVASLAGRIVVVADLEGASDVERARYHQGQEVHPESTRATELLRHLGEHGTKVEGIDVREAFSDVRLVTLTEGEVLMAAGSPPAFVYVPLDDGLVVVPGRGYAPQPVAAWVPLGATGVIRRATRNSDVVAVRPMSVVMIPGELYLRAWFRPYSAEDLRTSPVLREV